MNLIGKRGGKNTKMKQHLVHGFVSILGSRKTIFFAVFFLTEFKNKKNPLFSNLQKYIVQNLYVIVIKIHFFFLQF